ncbi:MAG TPA: hypothetical protein VI457_04415 [Methylococcaceae bacterium]|nr:hypothetical protein [Methylococcaceae bacterium]
MNAKHPLAAVAGYRRFGRCRCPVLLGVFFLSAVLGIGPDDCAAAAAVASAKPAVAIPASVFVGLWILLGILTGTGVGGAIVMAWRFVKRRQGIHPARLKGRISTFRFYSMVFWSALFATGTDVIFKLLAAYRVFFSETLTHPRALSDWQMPPGLNLLQTFLVMGVASFVALLIVRRLARQTDITGHASAWAFSAAAGILISIFVTMISGIFFPALDFWRVPGPVVLNFADDRRLVNLADLIGYLGVGLALIAAIFGWRHYQKNRRNGSAEDATRQGNRRGLHQ